MELKNVGFAAQALAGGVLLVFSSPAQAIVVYSGLQNITLSRPEIPGSNNFQTDIEFYTGESVDFGWFQDVDTLSIGIKNTSNSFKFDLDSPYSFGEFPINTSSQFGGTDLRSCTIADFTNCNGWEPGTGFLAYRFADSGNNYYGWAQISVPDDFSDPNAVTTLVDWAYQTSPNVDVFMGEGIPVDHVPAPLPVMGAAAAFAASRRLRRRIKGQV